ncbi:hypothetical protein A3749_24805 [Oleiphilus sp. HI0078]|uniref:hypothetical protein n=1 Tax=unclassified Oleiphilus TaxID=2631174 RepID=UPI0007C21577|nr:MULTISPECIES: hypothetical protein [unclassified Oleiphilus]KZY87319.1 hypothetical protein A3743_14870 [Oleiphilus sp. HI0072]KZZ15364.1 hypothetical protein A3749_24805 [Oleiphilus sp. HI0078]KZY35119.1 hypothetical protein A3729_17805 [Oleiphilus sp. HI0043]KZY37394.1 hypothetical protein A3729_27970 [Oleiphilus sp. HI0043]KZY58701.1 hypothetical protein A3735_17270 [Oleiphilus sp. HI0061]
MEKVEIENWSWTLLRHNENFILSVVCGSVGIYTVEVVLSKAEIDHYKAKGVAFIKQLASNIRSNPESSKSKSLGASPIAKELEIALNEWKSRN